MILMKGCIFGAVIAMLVMVLFTAPVARAGPMWFDGAALYAGQDHQVSPATALPTIVDGKFSAVQTETSLLSQLNQSRTLELSVKQPDLRVPLRGAPSLICLGSPDRASMSPATLFATFDGDS